jgi:hypothetical protein
MRRAQPSQQSSRLAGADHGDTGSTTRVYFGLSVVYNPIDARVLNVGVLNMT